MANGLIRDEHFQKVAEGIKPDKKRRVLLSRILEMPGVTFDVYENEAGQIVLDPQKNIPAYEAWLLHNPKALRSIVRGLHQSSKGQVQDLGSFAGFADDHENE